MKVRSKRIIILVVAVLAVAAAGISIVAVISKDKKADKQHSVSETNSTENLHDDGVSKLFISAQACPELSFPRAWSISVKERLMTAMITSQSMGKKAHMLKAMQSLIILNFHQSAINSDIVNLKSIRT